MQLVHASFKYKNKRCKKMLSKFIVIDFIKGQKYVSQRKTEKSQRDTELNPYDISVELCVSSYHLCVSS